VEPKDALTHSHQPAKRFYDELYTHVTVHRNRFLFK